MGKPDVQGCQRGRHARRVDALGCSWLSGRFTRWRVGPGGDAIWRSIKCQRARIGGGIGGGRRFHLCLHGNRHMEAGSDSDMVNIIEANRAHIEAALAHGGETHTFDDVARMIGEGKLQLWHGPDGCAVTEIIQYPQKRVLHCFLAGGKLDQILDMIESAIEWGKTQGCSGLTLSGRLGWGKVLKDHGFKPILLTMERPF